MKYIFILSSLLFMHFTILVADDIFTTLNIVTSIGTYTRTGFEDRRGKTSDGRESGLDGLLSAGCNASVGLSNGATFVSIGGGSYGVLSPKDALSYEKDEIVTARFSTISANLLLKYKFIDKKILNIFFNNGYRFLRMESNLTLKEKNSNIQSTYIDGIHIYNNYFIGPTIEVPVYHKNSIIITVYRYVGFNPSSSINIEYSILHPDSEDKYSKFCIFMELEKSKGYSQINAGISAYGVYWDLW